MVKDHLYFCVKWRAAGGRDDRLTKREGERGVEGVSTRESRSRNPSSKTTVRQQFPLQERWGCGSARRAHLQGKQQRPRETPEGVAPRTSRRIQGRSPLCTGREGKSPNKGIGKEHSGGSAYGKKEGEAWLPLLEARIQGERCTALLDTGAIRSFVKKEISRKARLRKQACRHRRRSPARTQGA